MTLNESMRPKTLDHFQGHSDVKKSIKNLLESNSRQDIILYGPPGTGKTTLARIIAYFYYGENYEMAMLDINASDDNGVDVIRTRVTRKAKSRSLEPGKPQIIFLDEAEALTPQAQMALRRTVEDYSDNCIFILATNNLNAIIEPLQSRCKAHIYHLDRLEDSDIMKLIVDIAKSMQVDLNEIPYSDIVKQAKGDARACVDFFESWMNGSIDIQERVYKLQKLITILKERTVDVYPLLEYIEVKDLTELSIFLSQEGSFSLEEQAVLNEIIAECDTNTQRSHNQDVHLIVMLNKLNEEMI